MLNAFRTFSSTFRTALVGSAAAVFLSACGGSTELGNGPEMLNENLPSSVTVAATASAGSQEPVFDWRTANGGAESLAAQDAQAMAQAQATPQDAQAMAPAASDSAGAPNATPAPDAAMAPAYGAQAAGNTATGYPPAQDANGNPAPDPAAAQAGATVAATPDQPAPLPAA